MKTVNKNFLVEGKLEVGPFGDCVNQSTGTGNSNVINSDAKSMISKINELDHFSKAFNFIF